METGIAVEECQDRLNRALYSEIRFCSISSYTVEISK